MTDATPDPPPVVGYRIALDGTVHEVLFAETTARQTIALKKRTGISEQRLFLAIETGTTDLEFLAAFVFLASLQRGEKPSWDDVIDRLNAKTVVEFERLRDTPEADDPGEG